MTYATVEKRVWVTVTEKDIADISDQGDIEVETYVDIDMSDYDDFDIQAEYEERFDECPGYSSIDWRALYEQRRQMSTEDFLSVVDKLIMDYTGRVL